MTELHPITPSPELIEEWIELSRPTRGRHPNVNVLATYAARWGADQELDACCEWLDNYLLAPKGAHLRAARRPKPPSLKEQALKAAHIELDPQGHNGSLIICALEALPDD